MPIYVLESCTNESFRGFVKNGAHFVVAINKKSNHAKFYTTHDYKNAFLLWETSSVVFVNKNEYTLEIKTRNSKYMFRRIATINK